MRLRTAPKNSRVNVPENVARLMNLARINRYFGTIYSLDDLDNMDAAQVEEMITLAEGMSAK